MATQVLARHTPIAMQLAYPNVGVAFETTSSDSRAFAAESLLKTSIPEGSDTSPPRRAKKTT